jgi:hypothetical protein
VTVVAITGDGATTLTVAAAATWPATRAPVAGRQLLGGPLVVEADPNGGSLAGWLDVPVQPSIATAAAAIGGGEPPVDVIRSMAHHTDSGLRVLTAPIRRSAARRAVAEFTDRSLDVLVRSTDPVLVDLGTLGADAPPVAALRSSEWIVVAHRQRDDTARAEAVRLERLIETLETVGALGRPIVLAVVGDDPFDPAELARFVDDAIGAGSADTSVALHRVPEDRLAAAVLCGRTGVSARRLARLPLMRSAAGLARRLAASSNDRTDATDGAA